MDCVAFNAFDAVVETCVAQQRRIQGEGVRSSA